MKWICTKDYPPEFKIGCEYNAHIDMTQKCVYVNRDDEGVIRVSMSLKNFYSHFKVKSMNVCEAFNGDTYEWEVHPISDYKSLVNNKKYLMVNANVEDI